MKHTIITDYGVYTYDDNPRTPEDKPIEEVKRIAAQIAEGLQKCTHQEQLIIDGLQKSASH